MTTDNAPEPFIPLDLTAKTLEVTNWNDQLHDPAAMAQKKEGVLKNMADSLLRRHAATRTKVPWRPYGNHLLIEAIEPEDKTAGGILLAQNRAKPKIQQGLVIEAGPGRRVESGARVPIEVKAGDTVYYLLPTNTTLFSQRVGEKTYLLIPAESIVAWE